MASPLLTEKEKASAKEKIPNWEFHEKRLRRQWTFKDFIEAFAFITQIAIISEKMNHHPEWSNTYSKVTIDLTTHDSGGITRLDIDLALSIDRIEETYVTRKITYTNK